MMDWTPIYLFVCIIMFGFSFFWDWGGRLICWVIIAGLIYYCGTDKDLIKVRKENAIIERTKTESCRKPKLESTADGVALYSFREDCYGDKIFFSKSGTQTEKCETHMVGKISQTTCKTIRVPNTEI
jgi:hypothetical protein